MKVAVAEARPTPTVGPTPVADLEVDLEAGGGLPSGIGLLERLETICAGRGLDGLAARLDDMVSFLGRDLAAFEMEWARLPQRPQLVGKSARHLLDLGGKRLRPLCLSLAARVGGRLTDDEVIDQQIQDLAVAIELVHSATLLHDDVVDMSDTRRGAATARSVYGNAASIFAGDWLLIEALRRVHNSGSPALLTQLFDIVEEMIFAESLQLENRGRLSMSRDEYFQVVEGKTASVFRWAMAAGAAMGGLDDDQTSALVSYGQHLGMTFQAVDDLLDLTGDATVTGKQLFTDLREGKMTLPLILALERRADLRPLVEQALELPVDEPLPEALADQIIAILRDSRAVADCVETARRLSQQAIDELQRVPDGAARRALETVATAIVDRDL